MMAEDVLAFVLYDLEREGKVIPEASKLSDVRVERVEEFVNYIVCDTIEYAKRHNSKAVKKTLTIPAWLNEAAIKAEINFSQVCKAHFFVKRNK